MLQSDDDIVEWSRSERDLMEILLMFYMFV